ncbi:c-type cytochrome [Bradyrhizobium sp. AZCC 2230]|uniref:c-type cytochrome n=1 Tax=Bradyrhizobium sp. AZCC 2230 TaxID=3117021 RepID=UPI002FEEB545
MRTASFGILSTILLVTSFAHAADVKEKAAICAGCHGENGISQTENIPSLAGQPDQFLQWQLVFFRAGSRKNEQMSPIAADLSNDDIRNLAAYFASLPPPGPPSDDDPALNDAGAKIAARSHCASCHTDNFAGAKAVARIAHQREDYLLKALTDFKTSVRSGGGQAVMADVAYPLTEDQIKALAHYLAYFK